MDDHTDRTDPSEEIIEGEARPLEEQEEAAAETSENKELEEARLKAQEYLDGWQRARAEFSNYKKRVEREQAQVYQVASGTVIKRFLDGIDDLERALKNRPAEGEGAAFADGVELIYRKFLNILEAEGVKRIEAEGKEFDPNMHEAITQEDSPDHESGHVIEVVKQGYLIGDRVLRPALVRVAR
jgi:molecular chaperone GrpE